MNTPENTELDKTPLDANAPCGLGNAGCSTLPNHHIRYARAWCLWQSDNMPDESKKILEDEMDSAQNAFSFDEFQKFKKTLDGYSEHWENILTRVLS